MKIQIFNLKQKEILNLYEDSTLVFLNGDEEDINLTVNLEEPNITVQMIYINKIESEEIKMTTSVNHSRENTKSYFINRTLLGNNAKFDFCGNINLSSEADGSTGNMETKALVNGENISWKSKPNLSIANKTATATHKATLVGYEKDQMRYLENRGIGAEEAKAIIQRSFLEEAIYKIPDKRDRDSVRKKLRLI